MLIGILYSLLILTSIVLIFLVLIQRGKGGGLAGAFGGTGGSSAFGTKAGDIFTKVTMYVAGVWIAVSMLLGLVNRGPGSAWGPSEGGSQQVPAQSGSKTQGKPPLPKGGTRGDNSAEAEPPPRNAQPPSPANTKSPVQPVNPGDPLAPLPVVPKK